MEVIVFKKSIIFPLAMTAAMGFYSQSQSFYFMAADDQDLHKSFYQDKDSKIDKLVDGVVLLKEGIEKDAGIFAENIKKNAKVMCSKQFLVSRLQQLILPYLICFGARYLLRDASPDTKSAVVSLAKKLNMENPENINVKVVSGLSDVLFGLGSGNAAANLIGDILIPGDFDKGLISDKERFVFGHELGHIKYKHALKDYAMSIIVNLVMYLIFGEGREGKVVSSIESNMLSVFKRLISDELQADLTASSLGKEVTEGGVKFLEEAKESNKISLWSKIFHLLCRLRNLQLIDTHPSLQTRINKLKNELEKQQQVGSECEMSKN